MLGRVLVRPDAAEHQQYVNTLAEEYEQVMLTGMAQHERSAQKIIGPSEIGTECSRALLYKLAQEPEPPQPPGKGWKPQVGTACHTQQETWFNTITTPNGTAPTDWMTERKVAVGSIGPDTIYGHTDLYAASGAVIDHKFVGSYKLKMVKSQQNPGQLYEVQAHTYGKGWEDAGHIVHVVVIVFHPRDGELTESYYWWAPFNRQIAIDALNRANQLYALLTGLTLENALKMFPLCGGRFCDWCTRDKRRGDLWSPRAA